LTDESSDAVPELDHFEVFDNRRVFVSSRDEKVRQVPAFVLFVSFVVVISWLQNGKSFQLVDPSSRLDRSREFSCASAAGRRLQQ
jgi:hypothetical protein